MKWLIVIGLIVLVLTLIGLRYRQQLKMAIYVWRMFRKMRQVGKSDDKQIDKQANDKNVPLVRCAKCGTWTAQGKSIKLRSGTNYCSTNCLETAVNVG